MNNAEKIDCILFKRMMGKSCYHGDDFFLGEVFNFYRGRLKSLVNYPLGQAHELIKMICRCAFNDSLLTDDESIVIIETCLDPVLDNILLEVNYNEGW